MADAVTVTLGGMGDRARTWIEQGRYSTMSEVVRAGLRALDREEAEFEAILKAKVQEALDDPRPAVPLAEAMDRVRASLRAR